MITVGFSTRKNNPEYINHLIETSGLKDITIIEKINNGEKSLNQVYNEVLDSSKTDIVILCHDDIKLEKGWGKKILSDFEKNPEYGIIGKAGTCYFPESGVYWEKMQQTMVGQVYHQPEGYRKWLSTYSPKLPFIIPVISVDGLFIAIDKTKIKHRFDETIGRFHFYDHLFCLPNYLDGVKIGVTFSFEIIHKSVGATNDEFHLTKEEFLKKWKDKLPLDLKPDKIFVPEIKEKPIKNIGKVAIIIPTKGKLDFLLPCVDAFFEHCNPNLFDIFIADTGSSEEEKNEMKHHFSSKENIKIIEYDYYNFAKINNDVVKNHTGDEHEFLLFCNNDIKILNNVIYGMLRIFKESKNVGTVGARLHFADNTIQHGGIIAIINKDKIFGVTHESLGSYYDVGPYQKNVIGNTGALLMIKKIVFKQCGFFNENYISCFEDVELNMKTIILGYNNIYDGSLVSYHYESSTRNEDPKNMEKLHIDYRDNLLPFVSNNFEKIKHKIRIIN
jgi:GT2 family glycosyltransferase